MHLALRGVLAAASRVLPHLHDTTGFSEHR
jgi:hypothetical protein